MVHGARFERMDHAHRNAVKHPRLRFRRNHDVEGGRRKPQRGHLIGLPDGRILVSRSGRVLSSMKLDARTNEIFTLRQRLPVPGGALPTPWWTALPPVLSLTLSAISLSGTAGTATLVKRFTFYPTGRVFVSNVSHAANRAISTRPAWISASGLQWRQSARRVAGGLCRDQRARGVAWRGSQFPLHRNGPPGRQERHVGLYAPAAAMVSSANRKQPDRRQRAELVAIQHAHFPMDLGQQADHHQLT